MAQNRSQSLRSMGVTALRKVATARGIKGLSKADRETCYRVIRSHCAPIGGARRLDNYRAQNGNHKPGVFTPAQTRRMAHKANRAMGGK